jgi:DNA-binding NarL/FixJ family response regulator
MNPIKVSIIEDVDDIRNGFNFLVNTSDEFKCIGVYSTAEEALNNLESNIPDVIIMDIGLPGMSGIECTKYIKDRFPSVQIMICTVFEDDDRLFSALSAGASGYVLKRTTPNILLESIKDIHYGGSPMTSQIARKVVSFLQSPQKKNNQSVDFNLSTRETEILNLLTDGYRNKEIAEKLFISLHTVKSHIYHIYEKLHVKSRVEAINKVSKSN